MKKYVILLFPIAFTIQAWAQNQPVKIVFDVTSSNEKAHQSAVRHVKMMSEAYPDSEFEVVVYSGAIAMVLEEESSVADDITQLKGNDQVSFKVCEATMKRRQIDKSQLLPGVGTVPDGILEIVTKQGEGWGYIKEAHN
ncbi:MAG: DsrE family protein [Tunicatimonas sp.]|uniref:DsrE family protein n=1 Tax=Tunicatimonas sp. TaxID=1940096 RepID=UPI003C773820